MHVTFVATRKNASPARGDGHPAERELYEMDLMLRVLGLGRSFLDLGPATVAACTPPGHDVRFIDDYIDRIDCDAPTDLVALSAKTSCVPRAYEVAGEFRKRGKRVVLGGIHASLRPEEALGHVDCVVTGEAEVVWPIVVQDAAAGRLRPRYDAVGFPPMAEVPVPAWDKMPNDRYLFQQVQTTRGCPFRCRFCSVPDISGQSFRFKPVGCVVRELLALPRSRHPLVPVRPLYVVDDNFISRMTYTRELLQAMVPLRREGRIPAWSAETTVNVARDEELLDLFRDAGCATLIIGFESVGEATLQHMDKGVNFALTFQEAVERIHARGMSIVGNFIVGFDTDQKDVFRTTLDFVQQTGILFPFFSILTPMPGTALHDEVAAEGRLDHTDWGRYDTRHVVFEPKNMARDELMDGYIWLYEQAYSGDKLLDRLERHWRRRPERRASGVEKALLMARLAGEYARGDDALRHLYRGSWGLLGSRGIGADPGQLLVLLDSDHFARSLRRWRSERWEGNVRTFETWTAAPERLQWENEKARRLTERASA